MVLVVKAGGRVISANIDNIAKDLVEISKGEKVVFIHGGGDEVTEMCTKLGIEPRFVTSPEGIRSRYTNEEELEIYVMVIAGKINKRVVSSIVRAGGRAIGISGADGLILLAERKKKIMVIDERGRRRIIDGGYTGKILKVDMHLLLTLLSLNYIVVVAPLAIDNEGTLLNVDGDQAAYSIATSLRASKIIYLTDVEGVLLNGVPVSEIKVSQYSELASKIGAGMNRKVMLAVKAVEEGVKEAIVGSGLGEKPVTSILNGSGTRIRA